VVAFDRPWQIVGLIALVVVLRVIIPRVPALNRVRNSLIEFDDSLLIALLVVFCVVRPFVLQAFFIPSGSMLPTLHERDRILVLKFWYRLTPPKPGDIVVFRAPQSAYWANPSQNPELEEQKDFIKRLTGVPENRLHVKNFALYRDGERVEEPYIQSDPAYTWPLDPDHDLVVPPEQHVVMGDNRNRSNDSTKWWLPTKGGSKAAAPFVPREAILGKAWLIFWPINRIRILH
jgi:signal peptidase I